APGEFASVSGQERALDSLVDYVNGIHTAQKQEAAREARIRAAVARLVGQPLYYTVRRGDALSIIATKFDATPDQIRQWNNIVGDRVRIGDKLLVKPAKK
ncbi:MAG TPA: LysM peptidoglycan-binding domain-containing protein, partial [Gemmatimonadaceae bacterium]|nr:LysM peptidoglycan-binding domain-containing protein [Gemmatimonadaceae bacterium]